MIIKIELNSGELFATTADKNSQTTLKGTIPIEEDDKRIYQLTVDFIRSLERFCSAIRSERASWSPG